MGKHKRLIVFNYFMIGFASKKIVNGKFIKILVDYHDVIRRIEISGDFFIHPEEALKEIEEFLIGLDVNFEKEIIEYKLKNFVNIRNIKLIGFNESDLVDVIKESVK